MTSSCPFCNTRVSGTPINKREASLLRSCYKIYYSAIISVPFVGSYIGGKISDWFSSPDEWYHRFVCPDCRCSWISTQNNPNLKTGGNQKLISFYYDNAFVIGNVDENLFMIQTVENGLVKNTVVFKDIDGLKQTKYLNGNSLTTSSKYGKMKLNSGLYIGELLDNHPSGWGALFSLDGHMWYGKWINGIRQGIGFECDFDGKDYRAGYWNENFII